MRRNFLYISLIASSVLAFTACTDEDNAFGDISGKSPIQLQVGMAGSTPASRAITVMPDEAKLSTLPTGTTLFMVMKSEAETKDTKWTMTKATTGEADNTTKASPVSYTDAGTARYWDDVYARDAKVSVYGICTPGGTPNAPTIGGQNTYTYTSTPTTGAWSTTTNTLTISDWTVSATQANLTATTFADQDLCYSNNVSYNTNGDSRLKYTGGKFDKGNLVFYHALTKLTVNMTAGDGFDAADSKKAFVAEPTAVFHSFKTKGDFEISTGVVTPKGDDIANITTFKSDDKEVENAQVVTRSAIVMPGHTVADTDKILTVSADGNPYDVTAAELYAAMPEDNKVMQQGTEYVINVRISKTAIKVAAYVKAWDTVNSETVDPKIDVNTTWGTTDGTAKDDAFSLYLSSTNNTSGYGTAKDGAFEANSTVSKSADKWTMSPQLYWSTHSVGYNLRSVWPQTATDAEPKVITSGDNQVISVRDVAYSQNTYPSDLMIGIPSDEPDGGITATEGIINLTFKYVMSQVEVKLTTTDDDSHVRLEDAKVEIINGYTTGEVLLKDRSVNATGELGSYILNATSTANQFLSAIVPQTFGDDLQFKITITNSDNTTDIYYATIKDVKVKKQGAETYETITSWDGGVHYVYNLKISKTRVNVSATLTPWETATADQEIWF